MKRNLLTLMLGILVVFSASAQYATNQPRSQKNTNSIKSVRTAHNGSTTRAVIFADDFETNKGWILGGEFERATPTGKGGEHGNTDPSAAVSGTMVIGTDLTGLGTYPGDYEMNIADRSDFAISPVIDCSGKVNVMLNFQQYLGVEENAYDHAYIDITINGTTWTQIWANGTVTISDAAWSAQGIDISAYADNQATVQIRFANGVADGGWQFCGWNIDDFSLTGDVQVANDLAVNAILAPANGYYGLTGEVMTPSVRVSNPGINTQATYNVVVTINDGTSDVYTQIIADFASLTAGQTADITFPTWTAAAGFYTLTATVALTGDANNLNDTRTINLGFYTPGTLRENFEGTQFLPLGWSETATASSFIQSAASSWWTLDGASCGTFQTNTSAPEMLITPAVLLDANMITFNYQAKGGNGSVASGFSSIQLKYSTGKDPAGTWTNVGAVVDLSTTNVQTISVDISAIPAGVYYFAFATSSTYTTAGFASAAVIDNVVVEPTTADDVELTKLLNLNSLTYMAEGVPFGPKVRVTNKGTNSQTAYSATITINDGTSDIYTQTVNGTLTLAQAAFEDLTFPDWTPTTGTYTVTAVAILTGDQFVGNNTIIASVQTYVPGTLNEDFEGPNFLPNYWSQTQIQNVYTLSAPTDWWALNSSKSAGIFQQIGQPEEMLITPAVAVAANMIDLKYQVRGGNGDNTQGFTTVQLKYATRLDGTWTNIGVPVDLNTPDVRNVTVDISTLTAGTYFFAFATVSTFDNGGANSSAAVFDNIMAIPTLNDNMELTSILNFKMANFVGAGMVITPKIVVTNRGFNNQSAYQVHVVINDGTSNVYDQTVAGTVALALGASTMVELPAFTPTAAAYTATADVSITADQNLANNTVSKTFTTYAPAYLLEDFQGTVFLPLNWAESAISASYQQSINFDAWTLNGKSAGVFQIAGMPEEMLVTPATLVDANVVKVKYSARGFNGSPANGASVVQMKYSTDLSGPWTPIGNPVALDSNTPQTINVNISTLANGSYYFAFVTTSTFTTPGFFSAAVFDDISIQSTVSVTELENNAVSIYPNPSNGTFTINTADEFDMQVIDIAGKVIENKVINSDNNTLTINQSGVYFIRLSNAKNTFTEKVIVK